MWSTRSVRVSILAAMWVAGAMVGMAQAQNTWWQGATGNWSTPGNWTNDEPNANYYAYINNGGTAQINQAGEVCSYLFVGDNAGDTGTIEMTAGTLTPAIYRYVGDAGTGTFTQSGGLHTAANDYSRLYIGYGAGSNGTYNLSGTGEVRAWQRVVGYGGTGTFSQTGGTSTGQGGISGLGRLYVAYDANGVGTYALSAGQVSADYTYDGYSGTGTFTQSGGTHTVTNSLYLGYNAGAEGTYGLSNGTLSAASLRVGYSGHGEFNWTGGTLDINSITIGPNSTMTVGQDWTYLGTATVDGGQMDLGSNLLTLDGPGGPWISLKKGATLGARRHDVGRDAYGKINVFDGTNTVSEGVYLGEGAGGDGTYYMERGRLEAASLVVGGAGTGLLYIQDPNAEIILTDLLEFGPNGSLTAPPNDVKIRMRGARFNNRGTDPSKLADLANVELVFDGDPPSDVDFEVASQDLDVPQGYTTSNVVLGKLTVGGEGPGRVRLVDLIDNQPGWVGNEALYTRELNVGPNSHLDLNGRKLFYIRGLLHAAANVVLNGGQLKRIPELIVKTGYPTRATVAYDPAPWTVFDHTLYSLGTVVNLTATPTGEKTFRFWRIFDLDHPDDPNYRSKDSNNPLTVVMDGPRKVRAIAKCGEGAGVPLLVILCGMTMIIRRRR